MPHSVMGCGFFLHDLSGLFMKTKYLYSFFLLILCQSAAAGVVQESAAADFIQDCIAVNHQYALARDHGDTEAYGRLFADDAEFVMQGKRFQGKEAILKRLSGGESNYFARLLITTVNINDNGDGTADGVVYFTMFHTPIENSKKLPITSYTLFMGEYHDTYRRTEQGCQIIHRETIPLFMSE